MVTKLDVNESVTKQKTRKTILEVACKLFVENGYMNTQMKDITEAANISKKNLYRYYSSKEELAFHIEMNLFDEMGKALLCEKYKEETAFEYIERFLYDKYKKYVFENEQALKFFVQFDAMTMEEYPNIQASLDFENYMQRTNSLNVDMFIEGQKDGSIRRDKKAKELLDVVGHLLMASAERFVSRKVHLKKELDVGEEIIDGTIDVVLSYIKG